MAKKAKTATIEKPVVTAAVELVVPPAPKPLSQDKPLTKAQKKIAESREALKHPLPVGQQFFEAPDGYIVVGEADKAHAQYRMIDGKIMTINPRR